MTLNTPLSVSLGAALALAAMTASHPASAQATTPSAVAVEQAPNFYRFRVGTYVVTALSDGTVAVPFDTKMRGIAPGKVRDAFAHRGETPQRATSINAYLVDTGTQRILIDAGAGTLFGDCCGRLPRALEQAGYPPASIDAVLLTHVHGDHSAGLTVDGRMMFPNALIYMAKAEYDFWMSDVEAARATPDHKAMFVEGRAAIAPYDATGRLRFFSGQTEIFPGIRAIPAPGHTPGHSFYRIANGASSLLVIGDVLHAAEVQLPHPEVTIDFDIDQRKARATRELMLADFARSGQLVAGDHVNFPGLGRIIKAGKGYDWAPVAYEATVQDIGK